MVNSTNNIGAEDISFFKEGFREKFIHGDDGMIDLIPTIITREQIRIWEEFPVKRKLRMWCLC